MSLPLLHAGRTNPGLSAALDLRFALDKSLTAYRGPTPSFSRASTGSYFDASGVLRYAPFNFVGSSEDATHASWQKDNLLTPVAVGSVSGSSAVAWALIPNATNSIHQLNFVNPGASSNGYALSFYAKAYGETLIAVDMNCDSNFGTVFNLANGTSGSTYNGAVVTMTSVGDGWYKCTLSKGGSYTFLVPRIYVRNGALYTGDGIKGVLMSMAQLEKSPTPSDYVKTTGSANSAPRFDHTYNGTSWVSKGLLVEEQRTNTIRSSEAFGDANWGVNSTGGLTVTSNSTVAPDGTTTGDTIAGAPATGGAWIRAYPVSVTAGSYTFSVFIKKTVGATVFPLIYCYSTAGDFGIFVNTNTGNLVNYTSGVTGKSSIDCGSYWRIQVSGSISSSVNLGSYIYPSATNDMANFSASLTGSQIYWGAQLEAGAFATSYIPNLGSGTSTRSADVCQITGGDFSGFWNGTEGTLACEFDRLSSVTSSFSSGFPHAVSLVDSGNLVRQGFYGGHSGASPTGEIFLYNGSGRITAGALVSGTSPIKISGAYKASDFAGSLNGATAVTSSSGSIDPVVQMNIGAWASSQYMLNGHIARLRYFNKRLPNATLQLLSEPDPTLNLQFALNKSLTPVAGPAPSFSRASTGTYFNASGVLTSASINTPRFDHVYSGGQWVSKGLLLEEQRTNQATDSGSLSTGWALVDLTRSSPGTYVAPDGSTGATLFYPSTSGTQRRLYKGVVSTNVISFFAKSAGKRFVYLITSGYADQAFFDLQNKTVTYTPAGKTATIQDVGNGWCRISLYDGGFSYTQIGISDASGSTSVTSNGTDGVLIWGAQAEAGSFPTSYIPTTGSATTRSADVCQITGTSFGWMWNQGEGSLFFDADSFSTSTNNQFITSASSGASSNSINLVRSNANDVTGVGSSVLVGGVVQEAMNAAAGTWPTGSSCKLSFGYKANDFAQSVNGTAVTTDTSGSIPNVSQMVIGDAGWTTGTLNGHIAKLIYYPARLTNTKLQQLST